MIKLDLLQEPAKLTDKKEELIRRYFEALRNGKAKRVWAQPYIQEALLEMAHGKCAYAEVKLAVNGHRWDVEHFKCKSKYKACVVDWENLLPSCAFCNTSKGDYDVEANEPIVHPVFDCPNDYLFMRNGYLFAKNKKGEATISVLGLNDWVMFAKPRAELCLELNEDIADCLRLIERCQTETDRYEVRNKCRALLHAGLPEREYSATVATFLMCEQRDLVEEIEQQLGEWKLWDEEMESTKAILLKNALPK